MPTNSKPPPRGDADPHEQVAEYVQQMYGRLADLSTGALRDEQPLLHATVTELGLTLEELLVAEEEMRVQNEQLTDLGYDLAYERQRYQDLFDAAPDAYLVTDGSGVIREANRAASVLFGLTARFLAGSPLAAFIPQAERTGFRQTLLDAERLLRADEWELRLQPRKRPAVTVGVRVSAIPAAGGRGGALRWIIRDISPRRDAEAERFRVMVDAIPHIAWTAAPDGAVTYCNRRWYDYCGLTFEQTRDWGWTEAVHPDDRDRMTAVWSRTVQSGTPTEAEFRLRRADGEYRWHLHRSAPLHDPEGRVVGWVGTVTDITARKEAEQTQAAQRERDHAIATRLQAALQPGLPSAVPGLALSKYYEPGLAEAGVGGDFYDVFPLGNGCTALVVGDLSGKGLAAAAQVAMVRNMLRAMLYSKPALAEAINDLNRILVENGLLEGFVTLFVGTFNPAGVLTYVNCGQEAALVRRAGTGDVEPLRPTGVVLGTIAGALYAEQSVCLRRGDAVAIFTDGVTEVGPSRREMLGPEGVSDLLRQPLESANADETAERLALRLIAGVDEYARGGIRDDVCLLVAVAR